MTNAKQRRKAARDKSPVAATTRDGFANLTARMGMGANNVLSDGMYIFNLLTKNRIQLEAMYRGSWIVGNVVDCVAEDMTRAGVAIKGEDDPEKIQQMQASMTRLGIWGALLETIKWGRLYGGALAVIIVDGQDMSTPLDMKTIGKDQFRGLKVYDRWGLQPSVNDVIQDGMDAGLPAYYTVVSDPNSGKVTNQRIHHSRVIRQIGIQLPVWQAIVEQHWGESVIERLHDRLVSFDTATAGAANLIQRAHLRTVGIDKLREILAAGGKAEENLLTMFHHMRMLQTNEGITLLDKEDQFQAHSYTFSGLSDMVLQFGQQISGASGIPLVRLFGQSPSGLNSTGESDLRMYYDNILAQQESRLREGVMRVLRVLHMSKFGQPAPENFDFDFVPLWQTSQKEKADIATAITTTVSTAFEKGIIDQVTALQELKQSSDATGVFSNIADEQIEEAKLAPPPMPVEGEPFAVDEDRSQIGSNHGKKPGFIDRIKAWLGDFDPNQPREPDGKFGSGGSGEKPLGSEKKPWKKLKADKKGLSKVEHIFAHEMDDPPLEAEPVKGFKPKIESVPVSKLIPTQPEVHKMSAAMAAKSLKDKQGNLPVVLKQGGKYFLLDGHHRVAGAIMEGKGSSIPVKVDFEVEE